MGESNTVVSAYTFYRHLQQYCSRPSIYLFKSVQLLMFCKRGLIVYELLLFFDLNSVGISTQ